MKTKLLLIVLILILAIVGYYLVGQKAPPAPTATPSVPDTVQTAPAKDFDIQGNNYSFDIKKITVKKGDTVNINFTNAEGFHDLKIDEFNVATPQLQAGKSASIQFVADKSGSFEYYCSVGQHRANGMWGTLTVEE